MSKKCMTKQNQAPTMHPAPLGEGWQLTLRLNRDHLLCSLPKLDRIPKMYGEHLSYQCPRRLAVVAKANRMVDCHALS
jgi:hypothetical protein